MPDAVVTPPSTAALINVSAPGASGVGDQAANLRLRESMAAGDRFRASAHSREQDENLRAQKLWLQLDSPDRVALYVARQSEQLGNPISVSQAAERIEDAKGTPQPSMDVALERIIGPTSDLQSFSQYLDEALIAGRPVGRIETPVALGKAYGTGFLISPDLLITNHHVLPDADAAGQSVVLFGYERDVQNQLRAGKTVNISPDRFFLTNEKLDFTVVSLASDAATPSNLGYLHLDGVPGKILVDQAVTIIQHPGGGEKEIALRQNKLLAVLDDFLQYETDTMPGASGSPVLNDQWSVVALHHAGVPRMDDQGRPLTKDGAVWSSAQGEDAIDWVANEGIRISRIVDALTRARQGLSPTAQQLLDRAVPPRTNAQPNGQPVVSAPALPESAHLMSTVEVSMSPNDASSQPGPPAVGQPNQGNGGGAGAIRSRLGASPMAPSDGQLATHGVASLSFPTDRPIELTVTVRPLTASPHSDVEARESLVPPATRLAVRGISVTEADTGFPRSDLALGDVLLYQGQGIISKGIMLLTESTVSHASIYVGSGSVGEALGSGLVTDTLDQSFSGHNFVTVRRLPMQLNMQPVGDRAQFYLAQKLKYAYQQIVFLAILLIIKKTAPSGILGKLIMVAAQAAAAALNDLLHGGKELMICSEFVYRCYDEASTASPNPYALNILGVTGLGSESTAEPTIVHPESVLARLARQPAVFAGIDPHESLVAIGDLDQAALEKTTEDLLAQYVAESEGNATALGPESFGTQPSNQDLAAAITQLSIALQAVQQAQDLGKETAIKVATAENVLGLNIPSAVASLFKTPADFVTPADLLSTISLKTLGNVFP